MISVLPPPEVLFKDPNALSKWLTTVRSTVMYGSKIQPIIELENTDQIKIISEYSEEIVRVKGKNTAVSLTSNPQVTQGYDGQKRTIEGSDDTNSVQLNNGNGLQLNGGNAIILKNGDIIKIHYNKERDIWIENYRSINRT